MKSLLETLFILFFITFNTNAIAQTYKIDSIIKGSDFNEYSKSTRDYFEGLIETMSEFTITIEEGDLAIVSMDKSNWKLLFRFYRTANRLKMSQEDYLKVNEFNSNSDIINGVNYIEMSVERVSGEISSGEMRFYPEEGLSKSIFTVNFSRIFEINEKLNNVLDSFDTDNKQRMDFIDIDHVPNFDYASLNELYDDLSESIIYFHETENNAYIEIISSDGNINKWEFYRVFGEGEESNEFITIQHTWALRST